MAHNYAAIPRKEDIDAALREADAAALPPQASDEVVGTAMGAADGATQERLALGAHEVLRHLDIVVGIMTGCRARGLGTETADLLSTAGTCRELLVPLQVQARAAATAFSGAGDGPGAVRRPLGGGPSRLGGGLSAAAAGRVNELLARMQLTAKALADELSSWFADGTAELQLRDARARTGVDRANSALHEAAVEIGQIQLEESEAAAAAAAASPSPSVGSPVALSSFDIDETLSDPDARDFWTRSFGATTAMTAFLSFLSAISARLGRELTHEEQRSLASALDHSGSGSVTVHKFGTLIETFGPGVSGAVSNLTTSMAQSWFHGFISYEEAANLLASAGAGTFLVRFSESAPCAFAIVYRLRDGGPVEQCRVESSSDRGFVLGETSYASLEALVASQSSWLRRPAAAHVANCRYFHGFLSFDQTRQRLAGKAAGTFLLRFSASQKGALVVAFVDDAGSVRQSLVYPKPESGGYQLGEETYSSIDQLVEVNSHRLKFPCNFRDFGLLRASSAPDTAKSTALSGAQAGTEPGGSALPLLRECAPTPPDSEAGLGPATAGVGVRTGPTAVPSAPPTSTVESPYGAMIGGRAVSLPAATHGGAGGGAASSHERVSHDDKIAESGGTDGKTDKDEPGDAWGSHRGRSQSFRKHVPETAPFSSPPTDLKASPRRVAMDAGQLPPRSPRVARHRSGPLAGVVGAPGGVESPYGSMLTTAQSMADLEARRRQFAAAPSAGGDAAADAAPGTPSGTPSSTRTRIQQSP